MERRNFLKSAGAASVLSTILRSNASASQKASSQQTSRDRLNSGAAPLSTQSNDLSPYTGAWGDTQLRHLLRRSMFGVPESQLLAAQALGTMNAVVAKLLDTTLPLPPEPASWVEKLYIPQKSDPQTFRLNMNRLDAMRTQELVNWWFDLMVQEQLSIRERMTLLWTNHFVTGSATVNSTGYMYTYLNTCRTNALGNFKDFTSAISIDPAMLVYLNGNQNYVENGKSFANENYARELMELFTMGLTFPGTAIPNYTQDDVANSARALTGWSPTTSWPFTGQFNAARHDTGTKTFLGQSGNWALQDILTIIFEQPTASPIYPPGAPSGFPQGYTAAYWACQKLYEEFVHYIPNANVIDAMARLMLQNNFEIAPVMQALLTSAHFYDANVIGAQLKSPAIYAASLVREFGLTYPSFDPTDPPQKDTSQDPTQVLVAYTDTNPTISLITAGVLAAQGQQLLNPPNVKGWPGGHNWISTGTFQGREVASLLALSNAYVNAKSNLDLAFNADGYAAQIPNDTSLSAEVLSAALEDQSLAFTLGPLESTDLDTDLQGTYKNPNYQYNTLGVKNFALYLSSLPEFQLF